MSTGRDVAVVGQGGSLARIDFDVLMRRFLAGIHVRPISKQTYKRNLRPFFKWITATGRMPIDGAAVRDYLDHLRDAGKSATTIADYMSAVKKFFGWASSVGLCANYAQDVRAKAPGRRHRKDPLTIEQVKVLLASIDRSSLEGLRNYAMLNLLVRTGLRTIEVVRADVGDIRQKSTETVLWVHGKSRQDKTEDLVVLTPDCLAPIMEYLTARGNPQTGDPLFASCSTRDPGTRLSTRTIRRIVKECLRSIGLDSPRLTAHSMRHSAISIAIHNGASAPETRLFARHSHLATTELYVHDWARLENAAEKKIEEALRRPGSSTAGNPGTEV